MEDLLFLLKRSSSKESNKRRNDCIHIPNDPREQKNIFRYDSQACQLLLCEARVLFNALCWLKDDDATHLGNPIQIMYPSTISE